MPADSSAPPAPAAAQAKLAPQPEPPSSSIYDSGLGLGFHGGIANAGTGGSVLYGLEGEYAWHFFAVGAEGDLLAVVNTEYYSSGHLSNASMGLAFAELRTYSPMHIGPFVRLGLGFASASVVSGPKDDFGASARAEIGLRAHLAPVFIRFYFSETTVPGGSFGAWCLAIGGAEVP